MSVIDRALPHAMSFLQLRDAFDDALDKGVEHVDPLLDDLFAHAGTLIAGRDRRQIVELRGRLARLRRRAARRDDDCAAHAVQLLRSMSIALDSGADAAIVDDRAGRRAATRRILRDRIVETLAHGLMLRPTELAERLDSGPSQVSRVLRELLDEGRVAQVPGPGSDRRATYYTLVSNAPATNATTAVAA